MDAEFRFFKKGNGGPLRVWPPVEFPSKTGFLGNPSKVVFQNSTPNELTFTDDDGALKPGQNLRVPAGRTEDFEINAATVQLGSVYGFTVTSTLMAGQEQDSVALAAANPEIIIVG
jgi:hypothetical protein